MKISASIRDLYNLQYDINKNLEARVRDLFESSKQEDWFYKGRVKHLESFAQKIETGRFDSCALEDFFACTIVVENRYAIDYALQMVEKYCTIIYRKPEKGNKTHKTPDLFSFDDLRLYVKLTESETSPKTPLNDVVFEIQIKTFLQHAWSIATHDLIYKGDNLSWSKARIAFQIKAMLENAEISIEQIESIAKTATLNFIDDRTQTLKSIIAWLKENWDRNLLPKDIFRLSQTLYEMIIALRLKTDDLIESLNADNDLGLGSKITNLSPYESILKALINHRGGVLKRFLEDDTIRSRTKLLITPEMEVDDFIRNSLPGRIEYARVK